MPALYGNNDLNAWNEACRNYSRAISAKNVSLNIIEILHNLITIDENS